jgi:hypothetical protein
MNPDFRTVEHGDTENVAVLGRAGTDDLGEERDADAHDLAGFAALEGFLLGLLFLAQLAVADGVHRLLHGGVIVAAVVFPAKRRLVRELLRLDEVLHAQIRRVHVELLGEDVHGPLDAVGGFRHPERAAVGDTAREPCWCRPRRPARSAVGKS